MKIPDDITLFRQISQNNSLAFDTLFRKYYAPLYHYALKICMSGEMAEDSVQMVFVHLWEHRSKLQIQQSVISYLFKAVRLKVYETFRSKQTKEKHEDNFAQNIIIVEEDNHETPDNYELSCLIWNAVDQLPEKCAEIFRLSRDEGLTYNEIAEHLGLSVKTVENQMGIAFKKLREILSPALKAKGWNQFSITLFIFMFMQISSQYHVNQ